MGITAILALIAQGVQLVDQITEQVQGAKDDLSESDLTKVEAALEELTARRHAAHESLQALIAAKRG
jgi:phytoene/squalene synthetase